MFPFPKAGNRSNTTEMQNSPPTNKRLRVLFVLCFTFSWSFLHKRNYQAHLLYHDLLVFIFFFLHNYLSKSMRFVYHKQTKKKSAFILVFPVLSYTYNPVCLVFFLFSTVIVVAWLYEEKNYGPLKIKNKIKKRQTADQEKYFCGTV